VGGTVKVARFDVLRTTDTGEQEVLGTYTERAGVVTASAPCLMDELDQGVREYKPGGKLLYPADGRAFLEALRFRFDSPYLRSSPIREEEE